MKKNFDQIYSTVEIDPVTDRYHITIPEEIINEFDWYEDLVLKWNIDGSGDIVLTEEDD
jgi:bifunctional DNA-binding transcriptional regulator/antitoxin component of YhaV-PrlF toxin-antitoxin module